MGLIKISNFRSGGCIDIVYNATSEILMAAPPEGVTSGTCYD
jgi:hypothetical protein